MRTFFVGPLPPPLHGFSLINSKMLQKLIAMNEVLIFNTALTKTSRKGVGQSARTFLNLSILLLKFLFFAFTKKPRSVYIGLSGGIRQIFDIAFLSISNLMRTNIYIHHHSFAYLNTVRIYNRLLMSISRKAIHIVLCQSMANELTKRYSISPERILVLSNAVFVENICAKKPIITEKHKTIVLGFLSNITLEKGILAFFEVLDGLAMQGYRVEALIAGPVERSVQDVFFKKVKSFTNIQYLGEIHNEKKAFFYQQIDLLLFPTRYKNEAEPVTILEALSYGVPVIAGDKGCISSIITDKCGIVFPREEQYVFEAVEYIKKMMREDILIDTLSAGAYQEFKTKREKNLHCLDALIAQISGYKI